MTKPDYAYVTIIAAPPEKVWEGLTSPEFTEQYWHKTRVKSDFKPGSAIEFLTGDGTVGVRGEILRADYPDILSYTWSFVSDPGLKNDPPSRVTFKLERLEVGTRLTVIHDQLLEGSTTLEAVTHGWPFVICGLKTLLETDTAVDFSAADAGVSRNSSAAATV